MASMPRVTCPRRIGRRPGHPPAPPWTDPDPRVKMGILHASRRLADSDPRLSGPRRRGLRGARATSHWKERQGGGYRVRARRQRLIDVHRSIGDGADLPREHRQCSAGRSQGPTHRRILRRASTLRRQAAQRQCPCRGRRRLARADARGTLRTSFWVVRSAPQWPFSAKLWRSDFARPTPCSDGEAAKGVVREFEDSLTWSQRLADGWPRPNGSWAFILILIGLTAGWCIVNMPPVAKALGLYSITDGKITGFDPYPFILYNLVLAVLVSLQGPLIVMSQNRQSAKDRAKADVDFRVNLKNEIGIEKMLSELGAMRVETNRRLEILERASRAERVRAEVPAKTPGGPGRVRMGFRKVGRFSMRQSGLLPCLAWAAIACVACASGHGAGTSSSATTGEQGAASRTSRLRPGEPDGSPTGSSGDQSTGVTTGAMSSGDGPGSTGSAAGATGGSSSGVESSGTVTASMSGSGSSGSATVGCGPRHRCSRACGRVEPRQGAWQ